MKKSLITIQLLLAVSSITATIFVAKAFASDNFYIEIGKPTSVEEIHEQWSDLSRKYKSTLGKLKFFPKTIINQQGETSNIIQVGPIPKRNTAEKICHKLFAEKIPCFVIVGIEENPPTMSVGISQAASSSSKRELLFPWQSEDAATQALAEDNKAPNTSEAEVAVAQAIPVPLSDNNNSNEIEITEIPTIKTIDKSEKTIETKPFPETKKIAGANSQESGSLIIETFSNETAAGNFWNYINSEMPNLIDGLHVRIQRPLLARNQGGVQITIYPFSNGEAAATFCSQTIADFDSSLKCSYEIGNISPNIERAESEPRNQRHTNSYEKRRQLLQRRLPSQQMELQERKSFISVQDLPDKKFWAQVAISDSKAEASNRLEEIRKSNIDIVNDIPGKITHSASAHARYTVRLGPINDEQEANDLCDALQSNGVDCLVFSTR